MSVMTARKFAGATGNKIERFGSFSQRDCGDGGKAIAAALENCSLEDFDISANDIDPEAEYEMELHLQALTTLPNRPLQQDKTLASPRIKAFQNDLISLLHLLALLSFCLTLHFISYGHAESS